MLTRTEISTTVDAQITKMCRRQRFDENRVRAVLTLVVMRHARLAWRFVRDGLQGAPEDAAIAKELKFPRLFTTCVDAFDEHFSRLYEQLLGLYCDPVLGALGECKQQKTRQWLRGKGAEPESRATICQLSSYVASATQAWATLAIGQDESAFVAAGTERAARGAVIEKAREWLQQCLAEVEAMAQQHAAAGQSPEE